MPHDPEVVELIVETQRLIHAEIVRVKAERDRARALAAKLEEVVAMRTAVLRALIEWHDAPPPPVTLRLAEIVDWADAQLSEIP